VIRDEFALAAGVALCEGTLLPQMNGQPALVQEWCHLRQASSTSSQQAPRLEVTDGQRRVLEQARQLAFYNLRGT
jgi:hypothetical protein